MPLSTEKVENTLLEYESVQSLESFQMWANIGCILPFLRSQEHFWCFKVILKMLVDNSEMPGMLNPPYIIYSIHFV